MTHTTLLQRLLHPEDLGHAVSAEVRQLARVELERWSYRPDRIYIAGPMTGHALYNYPTFMAAEAWLRDAGYDVINPARNGLPSDAPWPQHMRRDLALLLTCGRLALLPGWEASRGATLERDIAERLGMRVRPIDEWLAMEMAA